MSVSRTTRIFAAMRRNSSPHRTHEGRGLQKGSFSGGLSLPLLGDMTVRGSYRIVGDMITVTVSKKPSSYTWSQVDSMLRGFIESD